MTKAGPDIYVYKMVADHGGAPCITDKLLSLALCKPMIRRTAKKGSIIFGFGGKDYHERLIYVACITQKLEGQDYYQLPEYAKRADCIYRVEENKAVRKESAKYHTKSDERRKDVGFHFEKAFVLLSSDFRYLGVKGTDSYKDEYPDIQDLVKKLRRGHRRHHVPQLREALLALKRKVWEKYSTMKVGRPTDKDLSKVCNRTTPSMAC